MAERESLGGKRALAVGAACADLYAGLSAHAQQQGWTGPSPLWSAPDDSHPSPAGHTLVAERVRDARLQRRPSPPPPR